MDTLVESDGDQNQLQPCFLLHRGSTNAMENGKGSSSIAVGRRGSKGVPCDYGPGLPSHVGEPLVCGQWRLRAFHTVWGRIQKLIEDIIEEQNEEIYEDLQQWVFNRQYEDAQLELYQSAKSAAMADAEPTCHRPGSTATIANKQLHTALMFLDLRSITAVVGSPEPLTSQLRAVETRGGIDPSDHQRTFDGLVGHLRARKCHVARLTSLDFCSKLGIAGPLRVLFKQLTGCFPETTDMEILLAWHHEPGNEGLPVVIVVENAESCESRILAELLILLSDWVAEIPMVLILGMATTGDAARTLLPANADVRLRIWRFTLKSPPELWEVVMRALIIDSFSVFELSPEVVAFLYGLFRGHDVTVTAISRSFKVASMLHFWKEPLSFLCESVLKANSKGELEEECAGLPQELLNHAATLPSVRRLSTQCKGDRPSSMHLAESLWDLRARKKMWAMAFLCLHTAGKHAGIQFGDLLCESLAGSSTLFSTDECTVSENRNLPFMDHLMTKFRDMPVTTLKTVLEEWRKLTVHEKEVNADVCQLLLDLNALEKGKDLSSPEAERVVANAGFEIRVMKRSKLRMLGKQQSLLSQRPGMTAMRSRAEDLLQLILRQYLLHPESHPFSEVFFFKDTKALKEALAGETRRRVHIDLLNSSNMLKCRCCPTDGMLSSSLHDTTLAYCLSQDHSDIVKVPDWYKSFAAICDHKNTRVENGQKRKGLGRGRKRKPTTDLDSADPAENISVEARFTRAATELQIVGLVQLPKKGQSDSVRRICM